MIGIGDPNCGCDQCVWWRKTYMSTKMTRFEKGVLILGIHLLYVLYCGFFKVHHTIVEERMKEGILQVRELLREE